MLLKKLGKYEIIDWLGGGRFGDVFLARDTILEKEFALKISRMRKEEITMLKDEAKLLASLNHPNIVRFYNIDFIENKFVLVMEYIKGKTLRDVISDQGMEISLFTSIAVQILEALDYAHKNNVLHRDIKPENILLTEEKKKQLVKVTDFGLARFIKTDSISASTAGTPIYMSPEVWSGNFDKKSDIWSVGAVFYELLTGAPPYLADNLNTLRRKIEKQQFTNPRVLRSGIPQYLEDAVVQCLNTNPASRPSCKELLQKITKKSKAIKIEAEFVVPQKERKSFILTPDQKEVLEALDRRILLLGQAGCGKTTTLIYAVAELIKKGVPPSKILVCTFTNKAANDVKTRLQSVENFSAYELWVGTFHNLALRILRRDAERLDIDSDFSIEQPKKIFTAMKLNTGKYRSNAIIKFIEILKSKGITPEKFKPKGNWEEYCCKVYKQYQDYLRKNSILDYDDLILYAIKLLEEYDDIREYYNNRFEYIFVDELQDINPAQYRFIFLLCRDKFFFTGDGDQAIYGWRGADPALIYKIPKDFENVKIFNLTRSFRLPQSIIELANNMMLRTATAVSTAESGEALVYAAKSEKDEANYIVREIKVLRKEKFRFQDIAVLYRMNYISRVYEEAFIKSQIPYTLIGGTAFYERSDIKPLIEYLEMLEEHSDISISATSKNELIAKMTALFKLTKKHTERAVKIFDYHLQNIKNLSPANILTEVSNATGLKGENVDELISVARELSHTGISGVLNEIKLLQELDLADWGKDTVKLMTVHSAKGLEFPVVFVVDLAEDIFPLTKKMVSQTELEEERRLCYVAVTRAQKRLYLLFPKRRYGRYQQPSRFLVDMLGSKFNNQYRSGLF